MLRFEYAHDLATARDRLPWPEVATISGYADQAHLVRDWHEFTGRTPTAWRHGEVLLGAGQPPTGGRAGLFPFLQDRPVAAV